jgi:hypothetical protein
MQTRSFFVNVVLQLSLVTWPLEVLAERNVGDVPGDGELDEGTRAVLRRVKRPSHVRPEDWDVLLMRYKIKMARNAEVLFNGKVVDQDLAPLEGVRVTGIVLAYDNTYLEKFAPGTDDQVEREWEVVTDREGRFVVQDLRGFSLRVRRFEKEGYVAPPYDACYPIRAGSRGDCPEEGTVFKMWEKSRTDHRTELHRREIKLFGPADGREYRFDLATGLRVEGEGKPFDLGVKVRSASYQAKAGPHWDWSYELTVADGGIVVSRDLYGFEAPEQGYEKSFKENNESASLAWSRNIEKRFFVRSQGGTRHAMIGVLLYAYRDGNMLVVIDSVANTNSSRNMNTLR